MSESVFGSYAFTADVLANRPAKQVVDGDGNVIAQEYHRTSLMPHQDHKPHFEHVDNHLKQMGFEPVSPEHWQKVVDHADMAWKDIPKA